MARKPTTDVAVQATPTALAFGQPETDLAAYLGLDLGASPNVRTERAVSAYNQATRNMVEAGLLLASVKAELPHDEFLLMIEERGIAKQRAYELMSGAALAARLPDEQRVQVLALPKTKVIALANASPAVVEAMLADDDVDIDLLSVRSMRQRIKDLEADLNNQAVQLETAQTEAEGLRKKLTKDGQRDDKVPTVVADLRADLLANVRKAELAIESIGQLAPELINLIGGPVHDWVDPTMRQAVSGVGHLGLLADGLLRRLCDALPDGTAEPTPRSFLSQREIAETAQAWARLTALHQHEQALREWERAQKRPRGKGRPAAKPELEA